MLRYRVYFGARQENHFKVLPDLRLDDHALTTTILLHENLLSCCVPWCGNITAGTSIIAIGNRLQHPNGKFPAWVSDYEHDPFFWVSGTEGMSLLQRISGAVGFFVLAMVLKLDSAKWVRAISSWQTGPPAHLLVVQASSHLASCLAQESLFAVAFLMFLLSWDLYACPETLGIASACLRSTALIRGLVLLRWCKLSSCSQLSGPVLRDTARLSQRYPPIARYGVFGVSTWPIGCDTPSPFSERFPCEVDVRYPPPPKGYRSDTGAIPYINKANGCDTTLSDTISKRCCAIWGGISHWATKVL